MPWRYVVDMAKIYNQLNLSEGGCLWLIKVGLTQSIEVGFIESIENWRLGFPREEKTLSQDYNFNSCMSFQSPELLWVSNLPVPTIIWAKSLKLISLSLFLFHLLVLFFSGEHHGYMHLHYFQKCLLFNDSHLDLFRKQIYFGCIVK